MNATIYYFSGTGNSLAVARDISEKINGTLIPVASVIEQERIDSDADVIGIVFPIYDFKPAKIIGRFIPKLHHRDDAYLFAVCTYGITPGKTMRHVDTMLTSCGGKLSAGFAVQMPHNGLGSQIFSTDQHELMFTAWQKKCNDICDVIHDREQEVLESSNLFASVVLSGVFLKTIPILWSLAKQVITQGWNSLQYFADERCDGCGICQRICPVKNIAMIDDRPSWSDHCEGCFACVHWCPQAAVQIGSLTRNMPRYHHPEVKIADMIRE